MRNSSLYSSKENLYTALHISMVSSIKLWHALIVSIASNNYGVTTDKTHGKSVGAHFYRPL